MEYKEYFCLECGELHESEYQSTECPHCGSEDIRWEGNFRPFD